MKLIFIKLFLTVFVLFLALVAGIGYYGFTKFQTPSSKPTDAFFEIPKGWGTKMIAEQLKSQGFISDSFVFMAASRFVEPQMSLKAGEYNIPARVTMRDVLLQIKKGDVYKRQFTIPEGLTSYEILERLKSVPDIVVSDISVPPEGTLLPDTYQYKKDETLMNIITRMTEAQKDFLDAEWEKRDMNVPLRSKEDALILASIVEKETGVASERQRIAGVFINRLRQNIPLQTDPTVIYALTKGQPKNDGQGPLGRRLLLKDLQIDSPYNTYKNTGLPPTPIANAGREAILAVLHPENHDFIFFVADGTGGHVFASTLAEHNKNVTDWRKKRK